MSNCMLQNCNSIAYNEELNPYTDVSKNTSPQRKNNFIADAIEIVEKSIVYIEGTMINISRSSHHRNHDQFRKKNKRDKVCGSGFVVTENGIILTCAHLCQNLGNVTVTFSNGKKYKGYVIDCDISSDLAAIKITDPNLKFSVAELANYSDVRVGEWVVALGNCIAFNFYYFSIL